MSEVRVEHESGIATVWIDRPASRNAIALRTMDELNDAIDTLATLDPRVVVIRGVGDRAFISGGDLKELSELRTTPDAQNMARRMRRLLDRFALLPMPTIAALNGHALGGGAEVCLAADIRIAADDVKIAFNQSLLAIMPAWGGVERLTRIVGRSASLHLMLTGQRIDAEEAFRLGLLNRIVKRSDFEGQCQLLAESLASVDIDTARGIKSLASAFEPNVNPQLEDIAIRQFASLWVSEEHWTAASKLTSAQG